MAFGSIALRLLLLLGVLAAEQGLMIHASTIGVRVNGSGKVGLAWSNANPEFINNFATAKVSTVYNWSPDKIDGLDALGLEYIPMLWGTTQIAAFQSLVVPGYASHVLGFNEPDREDQSNLSPAEAAVLWKQYIEPLKGSGYQLISPSISTGTTGVPWLHSFFSACDGRSFDGVALHVSTTDPNVFIQHLEEVHNEFNLPVWVTQFACEDLGEGVGCTEDQGISFMNTVTAFMDDTDWVEKYFAFGLQAGVTGPNQLIDQNGLPTELGKVYID
ncbi:hypothetical protein D9613_007994 [Agrocybe pediades]|uniref:Asl1-like glycosyl hydrolase catalytic domain-containing protein n=1 Tax=Agrocybe pediades TaxID=84607 RepID=A0A8H4QPZ9_9AGAR|nr:hypothetical protein D9613_007994 [Agrocybe pediades]